MRTKRLYLACVISALLSQMAYAETNDNGENVASSATTLDTVNVKATGKRQIKTNHRIIDQGELKKESAQNIDDVALYEPGVDVRSDNMTGSHISFSIRGVDGNRILMNVDGIPLPDQQNDLGHTDKIVAGRDSVEPDTMASIYITKGGGTTKPQGDGAIGGSVNFRTISPSDLVDDEKPWYLGFKYGYRSAYKGHGVTATAAIKDGIYSGLAMLTQRYQHELENFPDNHATALGDRRVESNPQDTNQNNVLLKFNIDNGNHHVENTIEQFYRKSNVDRNDLKSSIDTRYGERNHAIYLENNTFKRNRYDTLYRYTPNNDLFDEVSLRAYMQTLDSRDDKFIISNYIPSTRRLGKTTSEKNRYTQRIKGIRTEISKTLKTNFGTHNLLLGAEFRDTKTSRPRDRFEITHNTKEVNEISSAYFAPAHRQVWSAYLQDNIVFENKIELGLGLRYESDKTTFDFENPGYKQTLSGITYPFKNSKNHVVLPSVILNIPLTQSLYTSLSYRKGYRSPDVNFLGAGFDHGDGLPIIIPNPALKPEKSDNYELSFNFNNDKINANVTAFYSRYKNFIAIEPDTNPPLLKKYDNLSPEELYELITNDPILYERIRVLHFHFANILEQRTYGLEASMRYRFNDNLSVIGSLAWVDAKDKANLSGEQDNTVLPTNYPLNGVLGINYAKEKWDVSANMRFSKRNKKTAKGYLGKAFSAPGYAIFDVGVNYHPTNNISLSANIYNVANKKYWLTADTYAHIVNGKQNRTTQPGRNFAVSVEYKF